MRRLDTLISRPPAAHYTRFIVPPGARTTQVRQSIIAQTCRGEARGGSTGTGEDPEVLAVDPPGRVHALRPVGSTRAEGGSPEADGHIHQDRGPGPCTGATVGSSRAKGRAHAHWGHSGVNQEGPLGSRDGSAGTEGQIH